MLTPFYQRMRMNGQKALSYNMTYDMAIAIKHPESADVNCDNL